METKQAFPKALKTESESVYVASDDSYLLIDAFKRDLSFIKSELRPLVCLEVGCGSGIVISSLANSLGQNSCVYFTTDINENALLATKVLSQKNNNNSRGIQLVKTDLTEAIIDRLANKIDLLLINPPFCPSLPEEVGVVGKSCSWAGGPDGRFIINKFLPVVPKLLSPKGIFYMVCLKRNNINEIRAIMKQSGLYTTQVGERKCGTELIVALRISRHDLNLDL